MKHFDASMTRRGFLQGLSMSAGALGMSSFLPGSAAAVQARTGGGGRVLVLGAGLAGLAAAWELTRAGHEVTVLEARSRPGGRVLTLRQPFADGLWAEAGAVAFSPGYTTAIGYIEDLGLERAAWAFPELAPLYHLRGRRFAAPPGATAPWPYELRDDERALGPYGLVGRYLGEKLPPDIADPSAWNRPPLADLDRLSAAELMRRNGASEGAIALVRDTLWFGPGLDDSSALTHAVTDIGLFGGGAPFVLAGGNDRLPRAMAERLADRIHYGVEVTAIRDDGAGVEILARRGDRPERYRADRAISTLPATVLRDVPIEPTLPPEQRAAIAGLPYRDVTRAFVQVRRAFWYDEGVSGAASTDLPVMRVDRHPYSDAAGPDRRAILESFVDGPGARRLAARPDAEVLEHAVRGLEQVHPGLAEHQEGGAVKAWGADPYALAAYSWPAPGQVTRWLPLLQRPHGRVHFAGEHTSILRATMEGALRSGVRAAREVVAAG